MEDPLAQNKSEACGHRGLGHQRTSRLNPPHQGEALPGHAAPRQADPAHLLGPEVRDAAAMRNVGGRATDEVIEQHHGLQSVKSLIVDLSICSLPASSSVDRVQNRPHLLHGLSQYLGSIFMKVVLNGNQADTYPITTQDHRSPQRLRDPHRQPDRSPQSQRHANQAAARSRRRRIAAPSPDVTAASASMISGSAPKPPLYRDG